MKTGRVGDKVIDVLKLFDGLVQVETHSNTSDSEKITEELLQWANKTFGLRLEVGMIRHWAYVNDVTFQADIPLLETACSPLTKVAAQASRSLSEIWHENIEYQPIILSVGHNPGLRAHGIAPFTIQRRTETRFSENIYFSESPLPTDVHIKLLEEFEAGVKAQAEGK